MSISASRSHAGEPGDPRLLLAAYKFRHDLTRFDWYDSPFLVRFEMARRLLAFARPGAERTFVEAFAPLRTRKDFAVRRFDHLLAPERFDALRRYVADLPASLLLTEELNRFGRSGVRSQPWIDALQAELTPRMSDAVGETVTPSYNFLSFYHAQGVCTPHMDAPDAKWTLDLCIDCNVEWPITFSQIVDWPSAGNVAGDRSVADLSADPALSFDSHVLAPNEAVVFSGSAQWHYRAPMPKVVGGFCTLLFLHFIPKGCEEIVDPDRWPELFDAPELAVLEQVLGRYR